MTEGIYRSFINTKVGKMISCIGHISFDLRFKIKGITHKIDIKVLYRSPMLV